MNILCWPWENGIKPYFTNKEGFEWYVDKGMNSYIKIKELKDVYAFIVKKGELIDRVLISGDQRVIHSGGSYEDVSCKIDILAALSRL